MPMVLVADLVRTNVVVTVVVANVSCKPDFMSGLIQMTHHTQKERITHHSKVIGAVYEPLSQRKSPVSGLFERPDATGMGTNRHGELDRSFLQKTCWTKACGVGTYRV